MNNMLKKIIKIILSAVLIYFYYIIDKHDSDARDYIEHIYSRYDITGNADIQQIATQHFNDNNSLPRYTNGNTWYKIKIKENTNNDQLVLRVTPNNRNIIEVYFADPMAPDKWVSMLTGNIIPWSERTSTWNSNNFLLPVEAPPEVYVKVFSIGNNMVNMSVLSIVDNLRVSYIEKVWQVIYIVFSFCILIFATYAYYRFKKKNVLSFIVGYGLYLILALAVFDVYAPIYPDIGIQGGAIKLLVPIVSFFILLYHSLVVFDRDPPKIIKVAISATALGVFLSLIIATFYDAKTGHIINNICIFASAHLFLLAVFFGKKNKDITRRSIIGYYVLFYSSVWLHIMPIMAPFVADILPVFIKTPVYHSLFTSLIFGHLMFRQFKIEIVNRENEKHMFSLAQRDLEIQKFKLVQQENFTTLIAHEINNPLGSIKLTTDLLRLSHKADGKRFDRIDASINQIRNIINVFVDKDRIESEVYELKMQKIDLIKFFKDFSFDMLEKNKIVLNINKDIRYIKFDPFLFKVVITNLLENAIKYSVPNTTITITINANKYNTFIEVKNICLITHHINKDKVFEKYYRGNSMHHINGMGVGLYLVNWIMARHNGSVDFEINEKYTKVKLRVPNESVSVLSD